jgi:hypothetical protein
VPQGSRVTPRPPRDLNVAALGAIRALRHSKTKTITKMNHHCVWPACVQGEMREFSATIHDARVLRPAMGKPY